MGVATGALRGEGCRVSFLADVGRCLAAEEEGWDVVRPLDTLPS